MHMIFEPIEFDVKLKTGQIVKCYQSGAELIIKETKERIKGIAVQGADHDFVEI
jgi:hypothetical protein